MALGTATVMLNRRTPPPTPPRLQGGGRRRTPPLPLPACREGGEEEPHPLPLPACEEGWRRRTPPPTPPRLRGGVAKPGWGSEITAFSPNKVKE